MTYKTGHRLRESSIRATSGREASHHATYGPPYGPALEGPERETRSPEGPEYRHCTVRKVGTLESEMEAGIADGRALWGMTPTFREKIKSHFIAFLESLGYVGKGNWGDSARY